MWHVVMLPSHQGIRAEIHTHFAHHCHCVSDLILISKRVKWNSLHAQKQQFSMVQMDRSVMQRYKALCDRVIRIQQSQGGYRHSRVENCQLPTCITVD
jgi:hypothetical protein